MGATGPQASLPPARDRRRPGPAPPAAVWRWRRGPRAAAYPLYPPPHPAQAGASRSPSPRSVPLPARLRALLAGLAARAPPPIRLPPGRAPPAAGGAARGGGDGGGRARKERGWGERERRAGEGNETLTGSTVAILDRSDRRSAAGRGKGRIKKPSVKPGWPPGGHVSPAAVWEGGGEAPAFGPPGGARCLPGAVVAEGGGGLQPLPLPGPAPSRGEEEAGGGVPRGTGVSGRGAPGAGPARLGYGPASPERRARGPFSSSARGGGGCLVPAAPLLPRENLPASERRFKGLTHHRGVQCFRSRALFVSFNSRFRRFRI